jgi:AcrR family transcriptional regulator
MPQLQATTKYANGSRGVPGSAPPVINRPIQVPPSRGRPPSQRRDRVVERLLAAAERQLESAGLSQTTERTIAAEAGVNHAMIHYYFGGMSGLLTALLQKLSDSISEEFRRLAADTAWFHERPTRHLIQRLVAVYYAKPWLAKISVSQMAPEQSAMCRMFVKRYGARGQTQIKTLLDRMIEAGIYDREVDTGCVAMSIMSLIMGPVILTSVSGSSGTTLESLRQDPWIDHLADLLDRQLRLGKA